MNEAAKEIKKEKIKNKLSVIEKLRKQKSAIEARIQAAEARLKNTNRKQETRRKILVGSYYLDKAIKENAMENLKIAMCEYLTRESDRKLFGFSEKHNDENVTKEKNEKINPSKELA